MMSEQPPSPARPRRRRTGVLLMLLSAGAAAAILALLAVSGHAPARRAASAPGSTAATPTTRVLLDTTPPPILALRPRLADGSLLARLHVPGTAADLDIIEGTGGAGPVAHDTTSAYPGEPHPMLLYAGIGVVVPSLSAGALIDVAASYGSYRYRVVDTHTIAVGQVPQTDAPELRLIVPESRTVWRLVVAELQPGDAASAAEIAQEIAVSQAEAASTAAQAGGVAPERLLAPLQGPLTQGFGPVDHAFEFPFVYRGVYYPHFHTGIDIAAPTGTPVHAAAAGVVVLAGTNVVAGHAVGYGTYVVIAHGGGLFTLYGHLSQLAVTAGVRVDAGDVIGLSGSTGNSTGPHLHFEVRQGTAPIDPLPLLQPGA